MVATVAAKIPIGLLCAGKGRPRGAYGEHFRAPAPSPVDLELSPPTRFWRLRFPLRLISRSVELPIGNETGSLAYEQEGAGRRDPTGTTLQPQRVPSRQAT